MNKVDEIAKTIAQAIEKANSAYIYSSECYLIVKVLSELRDRVTDIPNQSSDDILDTILTQLTDLCKILDSFNNTNWSQTSLQIPVEQIISNINQIMELLNTSLNQINIELTNKYNVSVDNISDDLNSIYGKLADPEKIEILAVKNKLDEIQKYLDKIGRPLLSSSQRKKNKITVQLELNHSSSSSSFEEDENENDKDLFSEKFTSFNDIQKYMIKKTDYTQDPFPIIRNRSYSIFNGKMKLSKENVTIMVLDQHSYPKEKFKRLINVLTAVKHPNLDSFVGATDSPLPFTVVTRRNGEKLKEILKRECKQNGKKHKKQKLSEQNDNHNDKKQKKQIDEHNDEKLQNEHQRNDELNDEQQQIDYHIDEKQLKKQDEKLQLSEQNDEKNLNNNEEENDEKLQKQHQRNEKQQKKQIDEHNNEKLQNEHKRNDELNDEQQQIDNNDDEKQLKKQDEKLQLSEQNDENNLNNEEENDDDDDKNSENDKIYLKPGSRTKIAFQIASAMAYLHSLNITHRDLCTSNIMIDKDLNPKITNLAIARTIPENTLTMSVKPFSSTDFKAPEITEFEGYNKEVDVFSFSGILYELLTNKAPFSDVKNADIEYLISLSKRPKLPEEISPELKELIENCWQQEPAKRPSFIDIVQTMLNKSIVFPQDINSGIENEFYGPKKIKNNDFKACFELFKEIQLEINNSYAFKEEATRIRTYLYAYQNELQSHEDAKKNEIENDNVNMQISNLKESLEGLLTTIKHTEDETWSKIALNRPSLEIPNDLHQYMKQIFISLSSIGLKVNKYDFNDRDLIYDLRQIYSIFNQYIDKFEQANDRMNEIYDFMEEKGFDLTISEAEISKTVKKVLSDWQNFEVERSDFRLNKFRKGSGGSCEVYKALQISTKKNVAVKVIKEEFLEDENGLKLLKREIGNLVQLENDYLIKFVGFNIDQGKPIWIITEYIDNGSLREVLHKKKLDPFMKTKIAFEIAQGMEYLKSKRIIHRDLKSDNILIDGDLKNNPTPKICDFGLARADLSLLMSNRTGTVRYMAPEVINGNKYDFKADVFSFGMILWELYAEKKPFFDIANQDDVDIKITQNAPLPYKDKISDDLKDLIEDAKNFDPAQRPSFTEIINRMFDKKISFYSPEHHDKRIDEKIDQFYKKKAQERYYQ